MRSSARNHRAQHASQRAQPQRNHVAQQARQRAQPSRAACEPARATIARSMRASARNHRSQHASQRAAPSRAAREPSRATTAQPSRAACEPARATIARCQRDLAGHHRAQQASQSAAPSQAASTIAREMATGRGFFADVQHGQGCRPGSRGACSRQSRGKLPTPARQAARARHQGKEPKLARGSRPRLAREHAGSTPHPTGAASSAWSRGKVPAIAGQAQHPRSPRPVRARRHFPRRWEAGSGHAPSGAAAAVPWGPDAAASLRHARNYQGQWASVRLVLKA